MDSIHAVEAVDAWATPLNGRPIENWPKPIRHVFEKYDTGFPFERGVDVNTMLDQMDDAGVRWAVLSSFMFQGDWFVTNDEVSRLVAKHPDRFTGAFTVDISDPVAAVREVRRCVEELGLRVLRLFPYQHGTLTVGAPPTMREYWPLYVACVEYDIPCAIQVGHTGPLLPSECGRPIYLDEVALTFPELTLIGTHLGDPWVEEMMILAWKHPNVYIETSARPPKHWSAQFRKFASTYGQHKVLWGTDYPLLPFASTLAELVDIGIPDAAIHRIVRENAMEVFRIPRGQPREPAGTTS